MSKALIMAAAGMVGAALIMLLQMFLSKREKKWPGLMLPGVFLIISFLFLVNTPKQTVGTPVLQMIISWLLSNVPTCIMLGIYFVTRREMKNENK